ncbi:uncharacterized protein LOC110847477 [Folsomia candida]|uniref:Putative SWI/SNF-related matrix-associated actin-dependent regulator of chromatin subfamily A member 3-like 1 n=1 Tax=Folsomia candida TaxID=158441 RepID=A0A226EJA7_FOLCA|nr:uncharacterized protein LOC110847477 [Folsomia candida]XP_021950120.1 uncharacterized protein LOC110847477 [Folsomia candida]OXA57197.1 putative SWI/SNF-related matrix-associated actin-dependent regulator of chromatin subfamily A member 3-like 1 [Folsomia candida]
MDFECPICSDDSHVFNSNETQLCMVADCGHVFHRKCVAQWQERGHTTCPSCRQHCNRVYDLYGAVSLPVKKKVQNDRPCKKCSLLHSALGNLRRCYVKLQSTLDTARAVLKEKEKSCSLKDWKIVHLKSVIQTYQLRLNVTTRIRKNS